MSHKMITCLKEAELVNRCELFSVVDRRLFTVLWIACMEVYKLNTNSRTHRCEMLILVVELSQKVGKVFDPLFEQPEK